MVMYFYHASPAFDYFRGQDLFQAFTEYDAFIHFLRGDSELRKVVREDKDGFFKELAQLYVGRTILQRISLLPSDLNVMYDSNWTPLKEQCSMIFFYDSSLISRTDEPYQYLNQSYCWNRDPEEQASTLFMGWQFLQTSGIPPIVNSPVVTGANGFKYMATGIDVHLFNKGAAELRKKLNEKINGKTLTAQQRESFLKVTRQIISKTFPAVADFQSSYEQGFLLNNFLASQDFQDISFQYLVNQPLAMLTNNTRFITEITDLYIQSLPYPLPPSHRDEIKKSLQMNFTATLGKLNVDDDINSYNVTKLNILTKKMGLESSVGLRKMQTVFKEAAAARQTDNFIQHVLTNKTNAFTESGSRRSLDLILNFTVAELGNQISDMSIFVDKNLTNLMISSESTFDKSLAYMYSLFGANNAEFQAGFYDWISSVVDKCAKRTGKKEEPCSNTAEGFINELDKHINEQITAAISYSRRRRSDAGVGLQGAILDNIIAPTCSCYSSCC